MWQAVAYLLAAYFIGAIPTGYVVAKKVKGIDIREHGSGNVGATNVKRVVGSKAGYATLVLDFLKGLLPTLLAIWLFPPNLDPYGAVPVLTAVALVVGHSKSIYIGFSGGKSVITSLGALIALVPVPSLLAGVFAVIVIKLTRYVSLGSIIGAILIPTFVWLLRVGPPTYLIMSVMISAYVIYLHRSNIVRLLKHQENRI